MVFNHLRTALKYTRQIAEHYVAPHDTARRFLMDAGSQVVSLDGFAEPGIYAQAGQGQIICFVSGGIRSVLEPRTVTDDEHLALDHFGPHPHPYTIVPVEESGRVRFPIGIIFGQESNMQYVASISPTGQLRYEVSTDFSTVSSAYLKGVKVMRPFHADFYKVECPDLQERVHMVLSDPSFRRSFNRMQ